MERMLKQIFSMALLVSATAMATDSCCKPTCCKTPCCEVAPYIYNRSVSENAARELAGWTSHVNLADMDKNYGSFSITPEYTRSFRPSTIASRLFNCDLQECCAINIVGSGATPVANGTTNWLADFLYLPTTYTGSFSVKPVIQNFLVDFNLYWGMDEWANGMFFRIHAPLAWTKWDLGMCLGQEKGTDGTQGIIAPLAQPLNTFLNFSCNQAAPADVTPDGQTVTYKFNPLNYSRLCPCNKTKVRLSDVQADFGWNFLNDEDYHLGMFLRAVAPTGNAPKGVFLFEPMIGNGHAWELGGGLTSHAIMWRSKEKENKHFGLYVDANITHLFNSKQCRFFDLCNKPWSRYNLAFKSYTAGTSNIVEFAPVADLTTHAVKVSVGVQADVVAMFNYTSSNFAWDLGYNFWGRSCEKFNCNKCCNPCKPVCATSCTTNNACCKTDCCTCEYPTFYSELDNKTWSLAGSHSLGLTPASYSAATIHAQGTADTARKFLQQSDIDMDGARTKGISNKIFTSFMFNNIGCDNCWAPYLGFGAEAEFGGNQKCCDPCKTSCTKTPAPTTSCNPCCKNDCCGCNNTAISQWGVWLKGGISF